MTIGSMAEIGSTDPAADPVAGAPAQRLAGWLRRGWNLLAFGSRRLFSQGWLSLATWLGLAVAVALATSIPLYADAVYYRLLLQELSTRYDWEDTGAAIRPGEPQLLKARTRPPFAFIFHYVGQLHGPVDWEAIAPLDAYLSGQAAQGLALPQQLLVRYFRTADYALLPPAAAATGQAEGGAAESKSVNVPLTSAAFAFASDLPDHIELTAGRLPAVALPEPDSPIEVLASAALAQQLGLRVGDLYRIKPTRPVGGQPLLVRIAGLWQARDPQEPYWFYDPSALVKMLFVPEATFRNRLSPQVQKEVYLGLWYLVADGSNVHAGDVPLLLKRISAVEQWENYYLPHADLDPAIAQALEKYQRAAGLLSLLLLSFSVPVFGLLLAFIELAARLALERHRNELAVLRSRGATFAQVFGLAALEAGLLALAALALGAPAARQITLLVGRARSFLDFSLAADLRASLTWQALAFGAAAALAAVTARLAPTYAAAHFTIVTYKTEVSRRLRLPWWQRAWLDVLLLGLTSYGLYVLRKQGSLFLPLAAAGTAAAGAPGVSANPLQNPLLLLLPVLAILAVTLMVLRLLPGLMSAVAWLAARGRGVGLVLAARHLARSPGLYTAPVLLLVWTLSLAVFTASLAQVMDRHLVDRWYYQIGADLTLVEQSGSLALSSAEAVAAGSANNLRASADDDWPWLFQPVSEHLKAPGVNAAVRVGRYKAVTRFSGAVQVGTFFGVDRADFTQVAFWRPDFAPASLGALLNALAVTPDGVLLPRSFMQQHALAIGDRINATVNVYATSRQLQLQIVGAYDLFPTWYPANGPLLVGNLEYLFEQMGGVFPYEVWLCTAPGANYYAIVQELNRLHLRVQEWQAPRLGMEKEQQQPERQGLFGLLSVGFLAAAALTTLGFLFYALFSFQRRFIELGVLRAIGLSLRQLMAALAWELACLIAVGVLVGTGLGVWISRAFIPYMPLGGSLVEQVPPLIVEIAWGATGQIYLLFGGLLAFALIGLTLALLRVRIYQAIKLGEAQ